MKKTLPIRLLVLLALILLIGSCASFNKAGELPYKWWKLSRGEVQNHFNRTSSEDYRLKIIFLGQSDSNLNINKDIALSQARLDAAAQLSRYLSQKVNGVMKTSSYIKKLEDAVDNGLILDEEAKEIMTSIEDAFSNFKSMITTTQFSSFMQEGQYIDEKDDHYVAYVCYSMPDVILEQTRMLQEKAFDNLFEETAEYENIMLEIQKIITQDINESFLSGFESQS